MSSSDTSAPRWRDTDPRQFTATVLVAAEQLGVLPLAVEKDHWVCAALRATSTSHPGQIVFKGGTSQEKLRIIRRFSEDEPGGAQRGPRSLPHAPVPAEPCARRQVRLEGTSPATAYREVRGH